MIEDAKKKLAGKALLITGGTGSFGHAVLRRFLDRNTIYEETREDLRFSMRPETRNRVQSALDAWLDR